MSHFTHDFKIEFDDVKIISGDCEFNEDGIGSYLLNTQPDDGMTVNQSSSFNNLINSITQFYKAFGDSMGQELTLIRFKKKTE